MPGSIKRRFWYMRPDAEVAGWRGLEPEPRKRPITVAGGCPTGTIGRIVLNPFVPALADTQRVLQVLAKKRLPPLGCGTLYVLRGGLGAVRGVYYVGETSNGRLRVAFCDEGRCTGDGARYILTFKPLKVWHEDYFVKATVKALKQLDIPLEVEYP